ncbi:hypothetical protein [Chroococcidiopsis sp. SAG 2025]|uniref:hypothetical protein n=1 Tax=Chroococcidiopsis sp. SAG 2025 TaxID=171389 RepID=UPI0029370E1E|nr:hypothetical protein [Chroococcidiopsis sp. SAG 2025]
MRSEERGKECTFYLSLLPLFTHRTTHHAPRTTILRGDLLRRLMLNYGGLG